MRSKWILLTLSLTVLAACAPESKPANEEAEMSHEKTIADVIRAHGERLLAIEGVSMVSEGLSESGHPCIKIGLIEENEELRASLPKELEGFPVEIEITGEFKPMYDR